MIPSKTFSEWQKLKISYRAEAEQPAARESFRAAELPVMKLMSEALAGDNCVKSHFSLWQLMTVGQSKQHLTLSQNFSNFPFSSEYEISGSVIKETPKTNQKLSNKWEEKGK